ncbi:MAG: hypothetical protein ACTSRA_09040 [Promethearchaeota archaeon]
MNVELFSQKPEYEESSLVYLGADGRLRYTNYTNYGEDLAINRIPDFSFAGYERGGVKIPNAPVKITLTPIEGDNSKQIQDAINQLANYPLDSNGFRGAILLKKGYYECYNLIYINASGIVLRGEGQGEDGTVLKDMIIETDPEARHTFININSPGSDLNENISTKVPITDTYVPTGTNKFNVQSTANYSINDTIIIYRTPNDKWFEDIGITDNEDWTSDKFTIGHERTIVNISGNQITVDIPLVDPIQKKYGGGYIIKCNITGRLFHCGVENMRLESYYESEIDELHGWLAIELQETENSWVRKVTARYFARGCVKIDHQSNFNTIEDCAMLDPMSLTRGSRKYSFEIDDGMGNLIQRCFTRGGRHDFVTGSKVCGPNVWLDCLGIENHEDNGPHGKWATGSLFDSVKGGEIANDRHYSDSQGWPGVQNMYWNYDLGDYVLRLDNPPGTMNWAIGCRGSFYAGKGFVEHWNTPVQPRSLYLAQLKDRLGEDAVKNIALQAQLDGYIWDALEQWAGEGDLHDYIN